MAKVHDIEIVVGQNYELPIYWQSKPILYKEITAITKSAPVTITVPSHGLTEKWPSTVVSVIGMKQINADNTPPKLDKDYHETTVIDADTIQYNDVNSSEFNAYKSGGYVQYNTPVDLTGFTAEMPIYSKNDRGSSLLDTFSTTDGRLVIDTDLYKISIVLTKADIDSLDWASGFFDLFLISAGNVGTNLIEGKITIPKKVI